MRARARAANDGDARYLASVTPAQLKELDANIERTVLSWLQKNQLVTNSLKVEKISEHVTPAPHRGLTRASPNGKEVHDLGVSEFPA